MTKIGVLTSGGDAPGLNAAIKGVVKKTLEDMFGEVVGIRWGYAGILNQDVVPLDSQSVRRWDRDGGTKLGTSRLNPFDVDGVDRSDELLQKVEDLGIDALVVIGGDGSLSLTYRLSEKGLKVVGIPKTIDKDVLGTDYTLGFDSAVNWNRNAINSVRNTAGSHGNTHIVEIMGRYVGHLTLHSGNAAGAVVVLIPEFKYKLDNVIARLEERRRKGAKYDLIVCAEKALPENPSELGIDELHCDPQLKEFFGVGAYLTLKLRELMGRETRYTRFGHAQRGASPTVDDITIGKKFGIAAVELIQQGRFGQMVNLTHGTYGVAPLKRVTEGLNKVIVEEQYDTQKLAPLRKALGTSIY